MMAPAKATDVLVVGAGPAGRTIALGLQQHGIDTICIEKREKKVQEQYGRASTLYPRSLELLETVGVTEDFLQAGYAARSSVGYRDGKRVTARGFHMMFPALSPSFHAYILNIRQNYQQEILGAKYKQDFGKDIYYSWGILHHVIDTSLGDGYNVTATVSHPTEGEQTIRCKYLIGADGGSSAVRRTANIDMEGDDTTLKWIRMDAKLTTDMPEADVGFNSLETKEYGNVLWVKLDRDAYRIGFALTPAIRAKYPDRDPTQEEAVAEALNAVRPFKVEIQRLDWWTVYSIKQKVAETLQKDEFVLLAGDAAHTHSSGFAQGANTAIHDATNLVWKLAGTLKGWYKPEVLATYHEERHAAAKKLINIDKLAADTISGIIPPGYVTPGGDADDALHAVLQSNMGFTVGLGVRYGPSLISSEPLACSIEPGSRSPDALVYKPGPSVPIRLHSLTHEYNKGRWSVIIFTGSPILNGKKVAALRESINAESSRIQTWKDMVRLSTLVHGTIGNAWDVFDGPAIGNFYFDSEGIAHGKYGISMQQGGIVVIRPEGVFAYGAPLEEWGAIEDFLGRIFA